MMPLSPDYLIAVHTCGHLQILHISSFIFCFLMIQGKMRICAVSEQIKDGVMWKVNCKSYSVPKDNDHLNTGTITGKATVLPLVCKTIQNESN